MTAFTKENLIKQGAYVLYVPPGPKNETYFQRKVVARFKRMPGAGSFMTHLRKNWTVEEYFARMDALDAPLQIVAETGYFQPHIKKEMKAGGYPMTIAGKKQMIRDQVKAWEARQAAQTPKYVECPDGNGFAKVAK